MANVPVRREPFSSLFDDMFSDFFTRSFWPLALRGAETQGLPSVARARMDVVDKGKQFEITLDLPGVKKEDIDVSIEGSRISVSAEAKSEKEVKEGEKLLHSERFAASYARSFELPVEVSEDGAEAKFENGVLTLVLPKREPTGGKRLSIR
ncbi:MAG TPA: Hsp20/alpha crystallin family protein [Burkholderiaceae bacterium]|nr:Hsp20/alpha crystallin family protein [Burkholderiaceae bacterium]